LFRFFCEKQWSGRRELDSERIGERERERGLDSERIGHTERGLDNKRIGQRELRAERRWGWWV
jgi:hypothetical protein